MSTSKKTSLRSFHGDPELKERYVARLRAHHEADQIVQWAYWDPDRHRGSAVGCTIEGDDHARYESALGLPVWLAHLEDRIFEGLPAAEAKDFARDFLEAIPVGSDLARVRWRFQSRLMEENLSVVRLLVLEESLKKQIVDAIFAVLELNRMAAERGRWGKSAGRSVGLSAWSAQSTVESAAGWTGRSAGPVWSARLAAAWSMRLAARSAWLAARSARLAAARSAGSAARSAGSAARSAGSAAWSARLAVRLAVESAWLAAGATAQSAGLAARSAGSAAGSAGAAARSVYQEQATHLLLLLREAA